MHSQALEELFVQELEELYDAEKQIYRGLSLLARSAGNADLIMAFRNHQKETKSQIDRLKKSFALLGEKPHRGRASGVAGFIRQTREMARQPDFDSAVIDAGLAASAEKIQKYQLAAYGCLLTHAGRLPRNRGTDCQVPQGGGSGRCPSEDNRGEGDQPCGRRRAVCQCAQGPPARRVRNHRRDAG